jgi:cell division transport system permease protein
MAGWKAEPMDQAIVPRMDPAEDRARVKPGRDPLGLGRAMPGRLLAAMALAMTLLAALALGGAAGAAALVQRWQQGAAAAVTVQLPEENPAQLEQALSVLRGMPGVAEARPLDQERLNGLLRPWLGEVPDLPLPPLIELRLSDPSADPAPLPQRIQAALPGAVVETQGIWVARLLQLAERVRQLGFLALGLVLLLAVAMVMVVVRSGLSASQRTIMLLHELGATDAAIAGRYAARVALCCGLGGLAGMLLAVPALLALASMAAPLLGQVPDPAAGISSWDALPWAKLPWPALAALPPAVLALGWLTAQVAVHHWLRRLP